jgi:hypothetical protein
MSKIEEILSEYEKGDMNKRLHLFLQLRDLRKDFLEIKLKECKYRTSSNPNLCRSILRMVSKFSGQLVNRAWSP